MGGPGRISFGSKNKICVLMFTAVGIFLLMNLFSSSSSCPNLSTLPDPLGCKNSPYQVYWNVYGVPQNWNVSRYYVQPSQWTATGDGCSVPGCKGWTQGVFPMIKSDGKVINGGVPQAANLTLHLETLKSTINRWLPDTEWSGLAVLDFEAWTTVWDENTSPGCHWHGKCYQDLSKELVKKEHPTWNESQVLKEAKHAFEDAATKFFVFTLNVLHELRPKAFWGFYGLPQNFYYPCSVDTKAPSGWRCSYDEPTKGQKYREMSDSQSAIWEASTALFPSIYIPGNSRADQNQAYVAAVVEETKRLSQKTKGKIPVFPFIMLVYHNETTWLSKEDLTTTLTHPYDHGACGLVIWGDIKKEKAMSYQKMWEGRGGPIVKDFIHDQCEQHPTPPSYC